MDAKQLRRAAESLKHLGSDSLTALADHVLSTVREDDGEALTYDNTPTILMGMGWQKVTTLAGQVVFYRSPQSKMAGPCSWVEYDPNGGCDAWSINGEWQIAPQETVGQLRHLLEGLGVGNGK